MEHVSWLEEIESDNTADNKPVQIFRYNHESSDEILNEWANHFRNHYCRDPEIDDERNATGLSRAQFLNEMKFPSRTTAPGPSTRSGDFGEILVADYLQYVLGYLVPRTRYEFKSIANESTKGIDVIGFKRLSEEGISAADELHTFEVKCSLTTNTGNNVLQKAIDDSKKDFDFRKAESLTAMKKRLRLQGDVENVMLVERYQNPSDKPYREISGAAAIVSNHTWDDRIVTSATSNHPNKDRLILIAIKGEALMELVHDLYQRACDNA